LEEKKSFAFARPPSSRSGLLFSLPTSSSPLFGWRCRHPSGSLLSPPSRKIPELGFRWSFDGFPSCLSSVPVLTSFWRVCFFFSLQDIPNNLQLLQSDWDTIASDAQEALSLPLGNVDREEPGICPLTLFFRWPSMFSPMLASRNDTSLPPTLFVFFIWFSWPMVGAAPLAPFWKNFLEAHLLLVQRQSCFPSESYAFVRPLCCRAIFFHPAISFFPSEWTVDYLWL